MAGVRASITECALDKTHWDLAAECVAYTRNYSPTAGLPENCVPAQLWWLMDRPPSVRHLQIFGSNAIMRIPTAKRKGKIADRGMPCIFVGYDPNRKGYRILLPDGKIQTAVYQDVVFLTLNSSNNELASPQVTIDVSSTGVSSEDTCENESSGIDEDSFVTADGSDSEQGGEPPGDPATPGGPPNPTPGNVELPAPIAAPLIDHLTPELQEKFPLLQATTLPGIFRHPTKGKVQLESATNPAAKDITAGPSKSKRESVPPPRYGSTANFLKSLNSIPSKGLERLITYDDCTHQWLLSQCYSLSPSSSFRSSSSGEEPLRYADIVCHPERARWRAATDAEIAQMSQFGTWELVPLPPGRKAIKSKWVFKIKRRADGEIKKYKARLTACGYSQRKGIDFGDVYAPVYRPESFRLFLAITALRKMFYRQMDVKGAFLHGEMDTETYMQQPEGYEDPDHPDWVCHLLRTIYGLKQSGHRWHKVIDPYLQSLGFQPLRADPCIYHKTVEGRLQLVCLYVDNLGFSCDSDDDCLLIRKQLMDRFEMTDEPTT